MRVSKDGVPDRNDHAAMSERRRIPASFVTSYPPEAAGFALDPDKSFVRVPLPVRMSAKFPNPFLQDLRREYRTEPVPPRPDDVDPAPVRQVFGIPKRTWESNGQHHSQPNDFGAAAKVPEWVTFRHGWTSPPCPSQLTSFRQDPPGPSQPDSFQERPLPGSARRYVLTRLSMNRANSSPWELMPSFA